VDIAVSPECRRRGVGAALLARIRAEAGGLPLTARIYPDNGPSLAMFAAAGFRLAQADGSAQVAARWDNTVIDS
jgi:N-acetylglutamate synthase-like GNAT family acetyltransferase